MTKLFGSRKAEIGKRKANRERRTAKSKPRKANRERRTANRVFLTPTLLSRSLCLYPDQSDPPGFVQLIFRDTGADRQLDAFDPA